MFTKKTLSASPGLARRLLKISEISGLEFNEQLAELACQDLLEPHTIKSLPWEFDSSMVETLQHVLDWRGRALLLESGSERSRLVALSSAHLRGGKTLVLAQPSFYANWATLIREAWPEATIVVFGNPRYAPKNAKFPQGIEFSEDPSLDADFVITSYGGIIWHELLDQLDFNQTIVEEIDHSGSINYKWSDALQGMFKEIPSPLFIQNIHNLPNDRGQDIMTSLQMISSRASHFLGQLIHEYIWVGLAATQPLMGGVNPTFDDYFADRGYKNLDAMKLLSMYGLSRHLLEDEKSTSSLTFRNTVVQELRSNSRIADSKKMALVEREKDLARRESKNIQELAREALDGNTVTQGLFDTLMTQQWANIKATHLKEIHSSLCNRFTRNLFLVDNVNLKRNLNLHFSTDIADFSSGDPLVLTNRFLYPKYAATGMTLAQIQSIRKVGNLMVTIDHLIENPILMEHANLLFLAQWPLDREVYQAIQEAAKISGTRIVNSVLDGTFEEKIYNQLL